MSDKWRTAQRTGLFLSEDEARFYFRQFISAVSYCHDNSVAHRCTSGIHPTVESATVGLSE